jgi:hypothetical protein
MTWTELSGSEALAPGAQLWLLPDLQSSNWAKKIDWYLNFQILRADHYKTFEPSPELLSTAHSFDFDVPQMASRALSPLLIASQNRLPNHMTACISFARAGSLPNWVKESQSVVAQLACTNFRIFLPKEASLHDFYLYWKSNDQFSSQDSVRAAVVRDASSASVLAT